MNRRGILPALLAICLLVLCARPSDAHIVPEGVGSQTWFEFRPTQIRVTYNLGFSTLLGYRHLRDMDSDHDGRIDELEKHAFLKNFGLELSSRLELSVDGKRVPLRVISGTGKGIVGPLQSVAFDTFFELVATVELGTKKHLIRYHEGNFPNELAQQYLWLPGRFDDYRNFLAEAGPLAPPPRRERGWQLLEGRDVNVDLQFEASAIVKDRGRRRAEQSIAGLEGALGGIDRAILRPILEEELPSMAFEEVSFETSGKRVRLPGPTKALAPSREGESLLDTMTGTGGALARNEEVQEEQSEIEKALKLINQPFSWAAILTFMILGAWHARGPGHGKTMVAAYLLGKDGTVWEAVKLGLLVTFTHTLSLYTIGLSIVYVVERYVPAQQYSGQRFLMDATFWITLLSGFTLVAFGIGLFRSRYAAFKAGGVFGTELEAEAHSHEHGEAHSHEPGEAHSHEPGEAHSHESGEAHSHEPGEAHSHEPGEAHSHGHGEAHSHEHGEARSHSHDEGHSHSHGHDHSHGLFFHDHSVGDELEHARAHADEFSEVHSFRDLMAVAISGGLVPCPMGVLIIIYSLQPQHEKRFLQCLTYLLSFSVGLGLVLTGIALAMVFFRHRLKSALESSKRRKFLNFAPLVSAVMIALIGIALSYESFDPSFRKLKAALLPSSKMSLKAPGEPR